MNANNNMLQWLWGSGKKAKTPAELQEDCLIDLNVANRQMTRAIQDLEREDKRLLAKAKAAMQQGKKSEAREHAKQITRYRGAITRMNSMIGRMNEVRINIQLMSSTHSMQQAMLAVTVALERINRRFNVPQMANILKTFQKESYKMNLSQDMMNDRMDETMAQFDDEGEENDIVNQVMDEIGLDIEEQLGKVPSKPIPGGTEDSDLFSRLHKLRTHDDDDDSAKK